MEINVFNVFLEAGVFRETISGPVFAPHGTRQMELEILVDALLRLTLDFLWIGSEDFEESPHSQY